MISLNFSVVAKLLLQALQGLIKGLFFPIQWKHIFILNNQIFFSSIRYYGICLFFQYDGLSIRSSYQVCDKTIYWLLPVYALFLLIGSDGVRAEDWLYTIRSGDNLWNVAERHLVSMKYVPRLQQLNRIHDPHHIPPGKVIRIPVDGRPAGRGMLRSLIVTGRQPLDVLPVLRFYRLRKNCVWQSGMKSVPGRIPRLHSNSGIDPGCEWKVKVKSA